MADFTPYASNPVNECNEKKRKVSFDPPVNRTPNLTAIKESLLGKWDNLTLRVHVVGQLLSDVTWTVLHTLRVHRRESQNITVQIVTVVFSDRYDEGLDIKDWLAPRAQQAAKTEDRRLGDRAHRHQATIAKHVGTTSVQSWFEEHESEVKPLPWLLTTVTRPYIIEPLCLVNLLGHSSWGSSFIASGLGGGEGPMLFPVPESELVECFLSLDGCRFLDEEIGVGWSSTYEIGDVDLRLDAKLLSTFRHAPDVSYAQAQLHF
ncbi:hypothetical protein GQR58_026067 [Nymphon striatum]|nr:hypothetical protein GQR58_026067 [Nymphon striatum]